MARRVGLEPTTCRLTGAKTSPRSDPAFNLVLLYGGIAKTIELNFASTLLRFVLYLDGLERLQHPIVPSCGVALVIEEYEALDPVDVSVFGAAAVMAAADCGTDLIKHPGFFRGCK